ncbi:MAG: hypothetical protein KA113_03965 [Syntrophaceae bacterium]|nr:hypothetical protein [Syntrophaceae bacterium]
MGDMDLLSCFRAVAGRKEYRNINANLPRPAVEIRTIRHLWFIGAKDFSGAMGGRGMGRSIS